MPAPSKQVTVELEEQEWNKQENIPKVEDPYWEE
jgi:hypothetical protein